MDFNSHSITSEVKTLTCYLAMAPGKNKIPKRKTFDDDMKALRISNENAGDDGFPMEEASDAETNSSCEEDDLDEEKKQQDKKVQKKKKDGVAKGGVKKSKDFYGKRVHGPIYFIIGADMKVVDLVVPEKKN